MGVPAYPDIPSIAGFHWIPMGIQGFDPQPASHCFGRWMFLRLPAFERIAMLLVSPPCLGHEQLRGGKQDEQRLLEKALLVLLVLLLDYYKGVISRRLYDVIHCYTTVPCKWGSS